MLWCITVSSMTFKILAGDFREERAPDPISNSKVKVFIADSSALRAMVGRCPLFIKIWISNYQ